MVDRKTFILALQVHSRLLLSSSHFAVKEAYSNLIVTVLGWYTDRKICPLLPTKTIEEDKPIHNNIVSILALLCVHCRELPKLWVRYPPRYVQDMVEEMIGLMTWRQKGSLSPSDIMAVVDPTTLWLGEWFHSFLSRSCFTAKLSTHPEYISSIVQALVGRLETKEAMAWRQPGYDSGDLKNGTTPLIITIETINNAVFSFNLRFISMLMSLKETSGIIKNKSSFLSALTGLMFMNLPEELGTLVSKCLQSIFSSHTHSHKPEIDNLIDRLCSADFAPVTVTNIISCIPVSRIDTKTQHKIVQCFLRVSTGPLKLEPEVLSSILKATECLMDNFPVSSSTQYLALLSRLMHIEPSAEMDDADKQTMKRSLAFLTSTTLTDEQRGSLMLENSSFQSKIEEDLDDLWEIFKKETEQGRPGFGNFENEVNKHLTRVGLKVLSAQGIQIGLSTIFDLDEFLSENEQYSNCILRLLIIATTSLHLKVNIKQLGIDRKLEAEIKNCFTDDDYIMDERYFLLKYFLLRMEGIAGPSEKILPSLTNPLQEFRPGKKDKMAKGGMGTSKHLVHLVEWLEAEGQYHDLGWIEETKSRIKDLMVNTTSTIDQSHLTSILRGFVKSSGCRVPPSLPEGSLSFIDLELIDMIDTYGENILNLKSNKQGLGRFTLILACNLF